jgi:hypothetical protein
VDITVVMVMSWLYIITGIFRSQLPPRVCVQAGVFPRMIVVMGHSQLNDPNGGREGGRFSYVQSPWA